MAKSTVEELKLELDKSNNEIKLLNSKYENQVGDLKNEVSFLKEQIKSQHSIIQQSIEYVMRLEQQVKYFSLEISTNNKKDKNITD